MSTKTYQVETADYEWYQRSIRCFNACPTHINAGKYAYLISEGRFVDAYKVIKARNPFPSVCGRVCHHPCEFVCKRREENESIAINPLKRFIADRPCRQGHFERRSDNKGSCLPNTCDVDHSLAAGTITAAG